MKTLHANRLIVLDTETTGLSTKDGNRIIEIGCVELLDRRLTGNNFHVYINPERDSEPGALQVHGLTREFLANKPKFKDIAQDFMAYVRGSELIIHNAPFDVGFLDYELAKLPNTQSIESYCTVFDTLADAKIRFPGQRNNLDALCKRYDVDNTHRELHGALLDAQILADVFLRMTGGQFSLMTEGNEDNAIANHQQNVSITRTLADRPPLLIIRCDDEEENAHNARLESIQKASSQCLWLRD
ncbi:MAG: polymerase subunit epsilon [Pseudomonadota bacterium]|jgi:DNA polymerase-3 subunit epsilon